MIIRVPSVPAIAWPAGWEDAEVVDSVLVEEPPAAFTPRDRARTGAYDRFGRVLDTERCGRIVSVLA